MMHFANPYMFLALAAPFVVYFLLPALKGLHGDALRVPFLKDIRNISSKSGDLLWQAGLNSSGRLSKNFFILFAVFLLLTISAARPQKLGEPIRLKNYSRDILMVMDISTSMLQPDFAINRYRVSRLDAVKAVAHQFIEKRANDRIGLVLFGSKAYLQAPITFDKKSVQEILLQMEAGMAGNSTAIGDALGLALKSLKDSDNLDKKIIILLTDGENNDGSIGLAQAISLARTEGVKIYTIGVGTDGSFMGSFFGIRTSDGLDEQSLKQIAEETKGNYYRAKNTEDLLEIYNRIDKIEPSSKEDNYIQEVTELFYIPLLAALILSALLLLLAGRNKA